MDLRSKKVIDRKVQEAKQKRNEAAEKKQDELVKGGQIQVAQRKDDKQRADTLTANKKGKKKREGQTESA